MNQLLNSSQSAKKRNKSSNPFAQALQNVEKEQPARGGAPNTDDKLFSDTLSKTGGAFPDVNKSKAPFSDWRQKELAKKKKNKEMQRKLHDMVNPVDRISIYNQREQEVKKEIEGLRKSLKDLSKEIEETYKEVSVTLMTETVSPGEEGTYLRNFFHKLREFIEILKAKIHSTRTWLRTSKRAAAKKKKKVAGLRGKGASKTEAVHKSFLGHEAKQARSGN